MPLLIRINNLIVTLKSKAINHPRTIHFLVGMIFSFSLSVTLSLGAGIGYLLGFFVYKSYSEKGNNCS